MSTANPITFFDLASTVGPFSPLTWRTRYVLNYKNIPYRTEWVGFADVETVLVSNGVPPTSATKPKYTVPAIIDRKDGQGTAIVADSPLIADYLESTYPANTIYPDGSRDLQHKHVGVITANVLRPIVPMVMAITATVFEGRDQDAFVTSRTQIFGQPLADIYAPEKRDALLAALYEGLDALSAYIDENRLREGEWLFGGDRPAYADFALGAAFEWFTKVGPEGAWDKIKGRNERKWERIYEACQRYSEAQ